MKNDNFKVKGVMIMNVKKLILASLVLAVAGMFLSGCKSPEEKMAKAQGESISPCAKAEKPCPFAKMFARKHKEPYPASPCAPGMVVSCEKYSGAEKGAPVLKLETMVPDQVVANQPFDYRVRVTNLTDHEVDNVIIVSTIPEGLEIKSSNPEQMSPPMEERARWLIGKLGANCSQTINAMAVASGAGTLKSCADVFYATCANINIVEPKLALTKSAPSESLMCDRIPLTYVITNKGSGVACDITVEDQLPDGLMTSDGSNKVAFRVDSLPAGQSRKFEAMVDASKPGRYSSMAIATWQGAKVESDMPATMVSQPVLAIIESGPDKEYVGRPVTYEIVVTNNGDGIAKDTVVEAWLPEEVKFESATESGQFTHMSPGKVTWHLGTLAPNESRKVNVTFMPEQLGSMGTKLVAKAYCAESVSSSAETIVSGIPGILLEVVDQMDPVEVGQNEMYTITVTNQGSAADTNIHIICELENGMEYVSSSGSTTGTLSGNKIEFAPLSSLASKERASWQVTVRAAGVGDMRFKASLTSDQLTRPVEETEATNFYK